MTYKLKFIPAALKEWKKLAPPIKSQFRKKLSERLENPRIQSAKLRGFSDVYKIKLKSSGYRLAYEVFESELIVMVLAVGRRERSEVYKNLSVRKKV